MSRHSARPETEVPAASLVALAAVIPRLATVGHFFNLDEWLWMGRSQAFSDALLRGHPGQMSALAPFTGTVPGITTVWLGSFARLVWNIGVKIGVIDSGQRFVTSVSGYTTAQAMVAIAVSALIGLFVWLTARWASRRVAVVAGVVFATEPFWVSLGSIVHTDELVALFAICGLVALALALGIPDPRAIPINQHRWAVLGAVLLALSVLTKASGLVFGVPALAMLAWAFWRDLRARANGDRASEVVGRYAALLGWMILPAIAVTIVTYPALVWNWSAQWQAVRGQLRAATGDRRVLFLGSFVARPGLAFYPVTLAYSVSLWFFLVAPVGFVVALVRGRSRTYALIALGWAMVPAILLLRSGLVYPRYGLMVLAPLTLAAASALEPSRAVSSWWHDGTARWITGVGVVLVVVALWVAPWAGLTFNPIMSAYRKPILVLPVGWGEATAAAMPVIAADAHAHGIACPDLVVSGLDRPPVPGGCVPRRAVGNEKADYVVVSASKRQRFQWLLTDLADDFDLIDVRSIRGQPIAEVWRSKSLSPTPTR